MNFRFDSSTAMLVGAVVLALVPTIASADDDFESAPAPASVAPAPASPGPRSTSRPLTQHPAPRATELPQPGIVAPYATPPAAVTPGQRYLTEGEIRSMIFGHTISGYARKNSIKYNMYIDISGNFSRSFYDYTKLRYGNNTNKVTLQNGYLCFQQSQRCWKLVLTGDTFWFVDERGERTGNHFTVIASGNAIGDTLK